MDRLVSRSNGVEVIWVLIGLLRLTDEAYKLKTRHFLSLPNQIIYTLFTQRTSSSLLNQAHKHTMEPDTMQNDNAGCDPRRVYERDFKQWLSTGTVPDAKATDIIQNLLVIPIELVSTYFLTLFSYCSQCYLVQKFIDSLLVIGT